MVVAALPVVLTILLLVTWLAWMFRSKLSRRGRLAMRVGVVLSLVGAVGNYVEYGNLRYGRFVNPHDVYHYYIGAKYSGEHQYTDLYRSTVLAWAEETDSWPAIRIRNLETHEYENFGTVYEGRDAVVARYSPERWEALKTDVGVFSSLVPKSKWFSMLQDKGYNPTPVWNLVGKTIAELVPVDASWGIHALTSIDLVLVGVMGVAAGWVLGWEAGLLLVAFLGMNVFGSFVHIKGAFLRYDWLAAGVGAVLALRSGRGALAGALVAWAAMVRVFPVLLVLGPAVLWAEHVVRKRALPPMLTRFFVSFTATVALLFLVTLPFGGMDLWTAFVHKMSVHAGDLSSNRMGLLYVLLDPDRVDTTERWARRMKLWVAVPALVVWVLSVRKRSPEGALAWGVIPVFLLTEATFYYYVMLAIPMVWLLGRDGRREGDTGHAMSAMLVLLVSVLGYVRALELSHHFPYFHELSVGLAIAFGGAALAGIPGPFGATGLMHAFGRQLRERPKALGGLTLIGTVVGGVVVFGHDLAVVLTQPLADVRATEDERELVFVGDIMLSRNVARSLARYRRSPSYVFDATRSYIQEADFAFGNLESPVSGRGEALDKKYIFNADPSVVPALEEAGFDLVSLANNHTLDYGKVALDDTVVHLDNSAVAHVGLTTLSEPQTPHIIDLDGIKVGTLAYCDPVAGLGCSKKFKGFDHGPAKVSADIARRDIQALKEQVDIVIVSMHWGIEYRLRPGKRQEGFARFLMNQGADIVAGHHPHVQQDAEWVGDGLAIYSMGNFVFDQRRDITQESRIFRVVVGKEGVRRASYLPLKIKPDYWQPRPIQDEFVPVPSFTRLVRTWLAWW